MIARVANSRFVYDILHGVDIVNQAFAKNGGLFATDAKREAAPIPAEQQAPSPEILVHLTNAGIVLPASSK